MQAQNLAEPLNQKIGKAIYISDVSSYTSLYSGNEINDNIAFSKTKRALRIEAQFRKTKIVASVKVKFHLY
ncbi:MAG: hypothetical protein JKY02_08885 [Flavobacteriaceae bacterium]|nr:hypothetical protein [Flavobacteriaceae bacterium]